jgi:hypothetical protein
VGRRHDFAKIDLRGIGVFQQRRDVRQGEREESTAKTHCAIRFLVSKSFLDLEKLDLYSFVSFFLREPVSISTEKL